MTDQELNEKIAVKRGYRLIDTKDEDGTKGKIWIKDNQPFWEQGKLPDYCNSWHWAGELLDDLTQKMNLTKIIVFLDEVDHHESEIFLNDGVYLALNWHQSDNKCRKIAEAWDSVNP